MVTSGLDKKAFLTFDVDHTSYISGNNLDEISLLQNELMNYFDHNKQLGATWFIRIDSQIEKLYNSSEYLLTEHKLFWEYLKEHGHKLGWHHHAYVSEAGVWKQNTNEDVIVEEIKKYGKIALANGLDICRMGWGYHTNRTVKEINNLGFKLDSSAIPRPKYKWELSEKDWSTTGQKPYFPSNADYRIQKEEHTNTIQVPINTVTLELPKDTDKEVKRYINPAYYHTYFKECILNYDKNENLNSLVLISHPYELIRSNEKHELIAFDFEVFKQNIEYLKDRNFKFYTLERNNIM